MKKLLPFIFTLLLATSTFAQVVGPPGGMIGGIPATWTFGNAGLSIWDSNASNKLTFTTTSDLTADRLLTFVPGDAARTITLSGNPTLADWFDQAVKAASSPTFAGLTLTADLTVENGGTGVSTLALNGILFGNAANAIGVTAIGAEGQLLRVGASPFVPAWTTSTFASTYVIGGLLHAATANTIAALAPGAIGSFLMSNGASAALSYLDAGAANYVMVGAGVTTIPVWTASTGTGAPVLGTSPTFTTQITTPLIVGSSDILQIGVNAATAAAQKIKGPDSSTALSPGGSLSLQGGTPGAGGVYGSLILQPDGGPTFTKGSTILKGPGTVTSFSGTVSRATTTITFSNANDAILAGYDATNPIFGTAVIHPDTATTMYITAWLTSLTATVDQTGTLTAQTPTSIQRPIIGFVNSAGVVQGWMNAAGNIYFVGTTDASNFVLQKSGLTGFSISPYWPSLNINMWNNGSQFIALGAGYVGVWAQNPTTGLMTFGISSGSRTAGQLLGGSPTTALLAIDSLGNILTGGITSAGTSAAKVLGMESGTAPTTSPADMAQMWVQDLLGVGGDASFHMRTETGALHAFGSSVLIGTHSYSPQKLTVWDGGVSIQNTGTLGSESLTNPNLTAGTSWTANATGDGWTLAADAATYAHGTGAGILRQTVANMVGAVSLRANRFYRIDYEPSAITAGCTVTITTSVAATAQTLTLTTGAKTLYFLSAAVPSNFDIAVASTGGGFTLDTFSLKEVQGGDLHVGGDIYLGQGDLTMSGSLADTTNRVTKGWFTNLEITNAPTINGAAWTTILQPLDANLTSLAGISHAVGDLIYATAAETYAALADVAAGSYLRSGGVTTAPVWSTLILPNAGTAYKLAAYTATNTLTELAAVGTTGQVLVAASGAIPAWSSTITGTIGGFTASNAVQSDGSGNLISVAALPVTIGGTGVATLALNGILYGNGASAIGVTAIGAAGEILIVGADPFVPVWSAGTGTGVPVRGTSPTFTTSILPSAAGATVIGTTALPFSSVFIGDAATNNIQLIGTAAAAEVVTIPGLTGRVQLASTCSAMSGTGGASTLTVSLSNCYTFTVTDDEDTTITFSGAGNSGEEITIIFLTAGTANETITFHSTLAASTGTLVLDTTAARYYVVRFISNGSRWFEVSRTAVQI